jgi:hypothetical protein
LDDFEALSTIIAVLKPLEPDAQRRVLQSVQTFLGLSLEPPATPQEEKSLLLERTAAGQGFSVDRSLSPKDFLRDKQPVTDIERVACLAYYLAYYRDMPHFKAIDISSLNTEAAQPKFSNTSVALDNARAQGYLVSATKGNKQLSAAGERFVELLPDRGAAREALRTFRPRRSSKKQKTARN